LQAARLLQANYEWEAASGDSAKPQSVAFSIKERELTLDGHTYTLLPAFKGNWVYRDNGTVEQTGNQYSYEEHIRFAGNTYEKSYEQMGMGPWQGGTERGWFTYTDSQIVLHQTDSLNSETDSWEAITNADLKGSAMNYQYESGRLTLGNNVFYVDN
jgi:hypothetical protein